MGGLDPAWYHQGWIDLCGPCVFMSYLKLSLYIYILQMMLLLKNSQAGRYHILAWYCPECVAKLALLTSPLDILINKPGNFASDSQVWLSWRLLARVSSEKILPKDLCGTVWYVRTWPTCTPLAFQLIDFPFLIHRSCSVGPVTVSTAFLPLLKTVAHPRIINTCWKYIWCQFARKISWSFLDLRTKAVLLASG